MSTDWKTLSEKTASLRTRQVVCEREKKDQPQRDVNRIIFAGLHLRLSEIVGLLTPAGAATITIFADTVVLDAPVIASRGLVLVARSVETELLKGVPLQVGLAGKDSMAQFLVGSIVGGPLKVCAAPDKEAFVIPFGDRPLQAAVYRVSAAGGVTSTILGAPGDLEDLFGLIWALNSMQAGFAAAAHLVQQGSPADNDLARAMLRWIVSAIRSLGASAPSDFAELYAKAAALMVEVNVAPGAYYLPVLSSDFYKKQVLEFLAALEGHETNFALLDAKSDLAGVIGKVGTALASVSATEKDPLNVHLANVQRNVANLNRDIQVLSQQVVLQQMETQSAYGVMVATARSEKIKDFVVSFFKTFAALGKAGMAFTAEKPSVGDGLGALLEAVLAGKKMLDDINLEMPNNQLVEQAGKLLAMQRQLRLAYAAGEMLFMHADGGSAAAALPEDLAVELVDPALAWDNYIVAVETEGTIFKEALGADASSLESVNRYIAALKIEAQYGKALAAKFVACATQMAAVPMIRAQIRAAEAAEARWKELSAKAQSDEERIAILKFAVQARADTIKRAIFVAWRDFRNSYFYLYFKEPSSGVSLDMNAAQIRLVFGKLTEDIARIYIDPDAEDKVALPADKVPLDFEFDIVRSGQPFPANSPAALFIPSAPDRKAVLIWTFDQTGNPFRYKLNNANELAVWVKEAQFFLDGIEANPEGNVMMEVSTSGTYQNGYGPKRSHNFVSRGLKKGYAYRVKDQSVYDPWTIQTEVYATPTPFTQWQITFDSEGGDVSKIRKLRVKLILAYRRAPQSAHS
jgi:hypothetical protein